MIDDDTRYEIAFSMVKNLNISLAEQILCRIGDERRFFEVSADALTQIGKLPRSLTDVAVRNELLEAARNEQRFITANDIQTLYFRSPEYPSRLSDCNDGPTMLYKLGGADVNARHIVSIVGTRHATPQGIETTRRIVGDLAERLDDLIIVSGLAYGIDVAAHKAALEFGVPTIAVMAHPLNTIYPADHRGVAVRIVREGGALLTEYSSRDEVHKGNFLARNRIIAGMADVTIVVESDSKGGSLVTARLAQEYNKEVFAVPGRLTDRYSQGTLALISSNRAHIYISADDLIAEMGWQQKTRPGEQLLLEPEMSPTEQTVYNYLSEHPASSINDIMLATSIPAIRLKDTLFGMELRELVMAVAGNRYSAL